MASETSFAKPRLDHPAQDWIKGMTPTLAMPLWAVQDAPPESGRFPLVVYAPSFSAMSWENADLCEYLASHGYVVVESPDMGATTRNMTGDLTGIDAQARDISFLIGYGQTLPNTDISKVAVAGFSWGGISNLFAVARDSRIDALIAFDGSMRYFPGLVRQAADVHPDDDHPAAFLFPGRYVTRRGFDHASEIHAAMQKDNPDFKLDKTTLTAWGDDLINDNALPEAISLLKFEVQIYPDTTSGHASLGRGLYEIRAETVGH
jgi:dienelactone hydrolase